MSGPQPADRFLATLARRARPLGAAIAIVGGSPAVRLVRDTHLPAPDHPSLADAVAAALPADPARLAEPLTLRDGLHLLPLGPDQARNALVAGLAFDAASADRVVRAALDDAAESYRRVSRRSAGDLVDLHEALLGLHADLERHRMGETVTDDLRRQLCFSFEQLMTLYGVGRMVSTVTDPREFVERALVSLDEIFDYRWYAVQYLPSHVPSGPGRLGTIVHGEPPVPASELARHLAECFASPRQVPAAGVLVPERDPLARALGGDLVVAPVRRDGQVIGCMIAGHKQGPDADPSSIESQLVEAVSDFLGVFHQNLERLRTQQSLTTGTVRALTAAIDAKDPYTRGHSERVGLLTRQIAEALGFDRTRLSQAHLAGLLHDVGKIGVPEAVLRKPGRLSDQEFDQVKLHPVIGHRILRDIEPLGPMLPGVLHHHERMDGRGYPDGLRGAEIPLVARIIAVADGFDAMSSNRAYRESMPRERVLAILRDGRGTQWDAEVVDHFLRLDLSAYEAMMAAHRDEDGASAPRAAA